MPYTLHSSPESYLASAKRFVPRYWTCNLSGTMTGSLITTSNSSLRAKVTMNQLNDFFGVQWYSADIFSHPLFQYATNNDYTGVQFQFTIVQSANLPPLNSPTDSNGFAIVYLDGSQHYIRLQNYLVTDLPNSSTTSTYALDFDNLYAGFYAYPDPSAVKIDPTQIAELVFSVAPPNYDSTNPAPIPGGQLVTTWDLTNMVVTGSNTALLVGQLPAQPVHNLKMATTYDPYNLTPERIVNEINLLGYRGRTDHYIGPTHFYDVKYNDAESRVVLDPTVPIAAGVIDWHTDFWARMWEIGCWPVVSVSFEIDSPTCPTGWEQNDWVGRPAVTGYTPPTYVSRFNDPTIQKFLTDTAIGFLKLVPEGAPLLWQIGEPWWWYNQATHAPTIFDAYTKNLYNTQTGNTAPEIDTIDVTLDADQTAYVNWCSQQLGLACQAMRATVAAAIPGVQCAVLPYLPGIVGAGAGGFYEHLSLPYSYYAYPNFDFFQIEDYEWVTPAITADHARAISIGRDVLGYPVSLLDYFAGVTAGDPNSFPEVEEVFDEAFRLGYANVVHWAYTEIALYGFLYRAGSEAEPNMPYLGTQQTLWVLLVYNSAGQLVDIPMADIESIEVEDTLNGGSGQGTFTFRRPFNNIGNLGYGYYMQLFMWRADQPRPTDPWWSGYFVDFDQSELSTDGQIVAYAQGDFNLLDAFKVTETLAPGVGSNPTLDAATYLQYALSTYQPVGFQPPVLPSSMFPMTSVDFNNAGVGDLLDTVTKMGREVTSGALYTWFVRTKGNLTRQVVVRVDQNPNVIGTVKFIHLFKNAQFVNYKVKTVARNIINVIAVIGGTDPTTGAQAFGTYQDPDSIAQYGVHEDVLPKPELLTSAACETYGDVYLDINAYPQAQSTFDMIEFDPNIQAGVWVQLWEAPVIGAEPAVIKQERCALVKVTIKPDRITQSVNVVAPIPYLDQAVYRLGLDVQVSAAMLTVPLAARQKLLYVLAGGIITGATSTPATFNLSECIAAFPTGIAGSGSTQTTIQVDYAAQTGVALADSVTAATGDGHYTISLSIARRTSDGTGSAPIPHLVITKGPRPANSLVQQNLCEVIVINGVPSFRDVRATLESNVGTGIGAPSYVAPNGVLHTRIDGIVGSRVYVSNGDGTWVAIPGV